MSWNKWKDVPYHREPIGGGNPYWRCDSCKQSDPYVTIEGHRAGCEYVRLMEIRPEMEYLTKKIQGSMATDDFCASYCTLDWTGTVRTFEEGQQLLAVLKGAWELMEGAVTPEDRKVASELAYEAILAWAGRD